MISPKKFASVRGIPSIVGMVIVVSVILAVGLAFVSGGYLLRTIRRKLRDEEPNLDWHALPDRGNSIPSLLHTDPPVDGSI